MIEAVVLLLLLFLLKQEILPNKIGVTLIWLLPIAFGLHVTEEFFFPGGFGSWANAYQPRYAPMRTASFLLKINAIGGVTSILLALGALNYTGGYSFLGVRAWLAFLTMFAGANALWHIRGVIQTKQYSPGVVTGSLIYLPLTFTSYAHFLKTGVVDIFSALICIAIAPAYHILTDYSRERNLKRREQV